MAEKFVLVAEDDKFYANIYKKRLSREEGIDVEVVSNGKEALETARKKRPDLILLDLIMPEMDGFEALQKFKEDEELNDIQVLVLSNLGQDEDVEKAKDLGAEEYLVKTGMSISEMIEKIRSYLET